MQPDPTSPLVDLDALKALCDAATPGPWEVIRDVEDVDNTIVRAAATWFEEYGQRQYGVRFVAELAEGNINEADAAFIAAAREAIPALLAALAEAQRELAATKKARNLANELRRETRLARELIAAQADAERMRPVVEAAAVYIRTPSLDLSRPHPAPREARALIEAVHAYEEFAAVDTYETQEGTDG